jgi:hypothetical protein
MANAVICFSFRGLVEFTKSILVQTKYRGARIKYGCGSLQLGVAYIYITSGIIRTN